MTEPRKVNPQDFELNSEYKLPARPLMVLDAQACEHYLFAVDYKYQGRSFTTHIYARNKEEASLVVESMRGTIQLAGQVVESGTARLK